MLTPESIEAGSVEQKMTGSMFIVEAESINIVRQVVESDIYYTEGVVSNLNCNRVGSTP